MKLDQHATLADSGLASHRDELNRGLPTRPRKGLPEECELVVPPDERGPRLELGPHWTEGSLRPPGRNRLGLAFDCDGIEGCVLDDVLRGSVRDLSDDDAAHGRHFLKAGGRVDHVPGDHALALLRPSRKRDDSLARVHRRPYSQVEPRTLVVELLDPVEDAERRAYGPLGVVFVSDRSAEDGHDCIPDELFDGAAETLDLLLQSRVVRPQRGPNVLRVGTVGTIGESDEIDEEDRHDLPLLAGRLFLADRCAARPAKAGALFILLAAVLAGVHKRESRKLESRRKDETRELRLGAYPGAVDQARAVLERLDMIDALRREDAPASVLLNEVRSLLSEAEEWVRAEPGADQQAIGALQRCREALAAGEGRAGGHARRVLKEVGSRLPLGHLADAEDATLEARVQACEPERVPHLVVAAARRHAGGRADPVEGLDDAVDRSELGLEGLPVEMLELVLPILGETASELGFDLSDHELVRSAHEALDQLRLADRPTELCEHADVDPHRDAVAVHQHSVAIENDELERPGHPGTLGLAGEKAAKSCDSYSQLGFSCTMEACRTAPTPVELGSRNGADTPTFAPAYAGAGV